MRARRLIGTLGVRRVGLTTLEAIRGRPAGPAFAGPAQTLLAVHQVGRVLALPKQVVGTARLDTLAVHEIGRVVALL